MTNGKESRAGTTQRDAIEAARNAQNRGITIFTLGSTPQSDQTTLRDMSSYPREKNSNWYILDSYYNVHENLIESAKKMLEEICGKAFF